MLQSRDTKLLAMIPVVIAAENDSDNVLADVMNVSFHRRYHDCSNVCAVLSQNTTIIIIINDRHIHEID